MKALWGCWALRITLLTRCTLVKWDARSSSASRSHHQPFKISVSQFNHSACVVSDTLAACDWNNDCHKWLWTRISEAKLLIKVDTNNVFCVKDALFCGFLPASAHFVKLASLNMFLCVCVLFFFLSDRIIVSLQPKKEIFLYPLTLCAFLFKTYSDRIQISWRKLGIKNRTCFNWTSENHHSVFPPAARCRSRADVLSLGNMQGYQSCLLQEKRSCIHVFDRLCLPSFPWQQTDQKTFTLLSFVPQVVSKQDHSSSQEDPVYCKLISVVTHEETQQP